MAKKVLVAISGGVDSSTAALLLKEEGYDVVCAHMKLWVDVDNAYNEKSIAACREICEFLEVPFHVLDLSENFKNSIIDYFVAEYRTGRTPNPCVKCNREIKWTEFLKKADELGCNYIATGHYVRIERLDSGRWAIKKGRDDSRDQSYVLWRLTQTDLARTLTPLGEKLKTDVRQIARERGLPTAEKSESREICFIPDDDYNRFLREYGQKENLAFEPGEVVHEDGRVLGQHKGVAFYTIGQRRGMGISNPTPLYVKKIDVAHNRIIVGEDDSLFRKEVEIEDVNWVGMAPTEKSFEASVKIRYKHEPAPAMISPLTDKKVRIIFRDKQRAITPGQSAVFYDNDILLGGGIIS
jgi:tRNA-specific 2-thiouridylase